MPLATRELADLLCIDADTVTRLRGSLVPTPLVRAVEGQARLRTSLKMRAQVLA